jgi:hypothetical protein
MEPGNEPAMFSERGFAYLAGVGETLIVSHLAMELYP